MEQKGWWVGGGRGSGGRTSRQICGINYRAVGRNTDGVELNCEGERERAPAGEGGSSFCLGRCGGRTGFCRGDNIRSSVSMGSFKVPLRHPAGAVRTSESLSQGRVKREP